jgi:Flp pilus assembly CpaE family ATPase
MIEHIGVVLAHDDTRVREEIAKTLETVPDLFVAGTSPDAVAFADVVVAGGASLDALRAEPPPRPVVVLADGDAIRAARAALAAGASEILRWPDERDRLAFAIRAAAHTARPEPARRAAGRVVAVMGARGGVGTSTLAAALASAFVARKRDAIVLDLDPVGAGQGTFHAGEPERVLGDLGTALDDLTPDALRQALAPHASGALCAYGRPFGPAPGPAAARGLVRAARAAAAITVADLGRAASDADLVVAAEAGARLVLVTADVAAVRGARALLDRLGVAADVVLRRTRGATVMARDVAVALDAHPVATIDEDRRVARASALGRVVVPRSVRRLARALEDGWNEP